MTKNLVVCLALMLATVSAFGANSTESKNSNSQKTTKSAKSNLHKDILKSTSASATRASVSNFSDRAPVSSMTDRPMILSSGTMQGSAEMGLSHTSLSANNSQISIGQTGFDTTYGFEMGLGKGFQTGAAINLPFAPKFNVGFIFDGQYGVTDWMNVRMDMGRNVIAYPGQITVSPTNANDVSFSEYGTNSSFFIGIGAPVRVRLNHSWNLIGGRTSVLSAMHTPSFLAMQTDDIFTAHFNGDGNYTTLGLPVGVEHRFSQNFGMRFRTGFRTMMGNGTGTYIPLSFDAMTAPARGWDLGATLAFAGAVSAPISGTQGYFANQNLTVWTQTRF